MQNKTIRHILKQARKKLAEAERPRTSTFIRPDDDEEDYVGVGVEGLLGAADKLLNINRGVEKPDERDSLIYTRVYSPADLIRERIQLDSGKIRRQLMHRLTYKRNLKSVQQRPLDPYFQQFIISNPLSMPLEEINPLHIADQRRRISSMGEGGLSSPEVVTEEMRSIHPSEFGFMSPLEGPEGLLIGVDRRAAWDTKLGDDGNIYQRFRDRRTDEERWLSPVDLDGSKILMPE